jgi:hypothetical protein
VEPNNEDSDLGNNLKLTNDVPTQQPLKILVNNKTSNEEGDEN